MTIDCDFSSTNFFSSYLLRIECVARWEKQTEHIHAVAICDAWSVTTMPQRHCDYCPVFFSRYEYKCMIWGALRLGGEMEETIIWASHHLCVIRVEWITLFLGMCYKTQKMFLIWMKAHFFRNCKWCNVSFAINTFACFLAAVDIQSKYSTHNKTQKTFYNRIIFLCVLIAQHCSNQIYYSKFNRNCLNLSAHNRLYVSLRIYIGAKRVPFHIVRSCRWVLYADSNIIFILRIYAICLRKIEDVCRMKIGCADTEVWYRYYLLLTLNSRKTRINWVGVRQKIAVWRKLVITFRTQSRIANGYYYTNSAIADRIAMRNVYDSNSANWALST